MEKSDVHEDHQPRTESPSSSEDKSVVDGDTLTWTDEEERVIRRKLDFRVVPLVTILYLLCFLDRSNVGNARIQGMGEDLELTGFRFNWALTVFYFTYTA